MGEPRVGDWVDFFADEAFLRDVCREVVRQDDRHPAGYPATRDGVFLGIKTAVHELDVEAMGAWDDEKRRHTWAGTRAEVVQAAAILLRLVRSIDYAEPARPPAPEEADRG